MTEQTFTITEMRPENGELDAEFTWKTEASTPEAALRADFSLMSDYSVELISDNEEHGIHGSLEGTLCTDNWYWVYAEDGKFLGIYKIAKIDRD